MPEPGYWVVMAPSHGGNTPGGLVFSEQSPAVFTGWEGSSGMLCSPPVPSLLQLIDLCSPLIQLSPEADKENVDSPLLKF